MSERVPMRRCMVCRASREKNTLIRIAAAADGELRIDGDMHMPGRGNYICRDSECIRLALKRKTFTRLAGHEVPEEFYDELRRYVTDET